MFMYMYSMLKFMQFIHFVSDTLTHRVHSNNSIVIFWIFPSHINGIIYEFSGDISWLTWDYNKSLWFIQRITHFENNLQRNVSCKWKTRKVSEKIISFIACISETVNDFLLNLLEKKDHKIPYTVIKKKEH